MAVALRQIEPREYQYICTPTLDESPEMDAHWANLERLLEAPLLRISKESLAGLVFRQKALPNWRMRWCTRILKIEPFENYILDQRPCTIYVGIRADEVDRDGVAWEQVSDGIVRRYPLVEWNWGIGDVYGLLEARGIVIPDRTDCELCFFQTLYEWYLLWLNRRSKFMQGVAWEAFTGHTLRSDKRDTWPAALADLAREFERGRIPKQRTTMKDRKIMCSVCAR